MKKLMVICCSLLLASIAFAKGQEIASDKILIKTPTVKAVPSGKNNTRVYMDLVNRGNKEHRVIAAFSPFAKQTQLHKTYRKHGKLAMKQIKELKLKPKKEEDMKKDRLHIMLIGLSQTLKPGEIVPVALIFADGSDLTVGARVSKTKVKTKA